VGATGDDVDFILREGYLEAIHRGTYSEYPYKKFITGSIQACKDQGVDLLFVDISTLAEFHPTSTQRYEMGTLASQLGKGLSRLAIYGTPEQIEEQFGTLVARNRGLDIQAFTDRNEALRWLQG